MSKYIPSERGDTKYLPLTERQLSVLVYCYYSGISARHAAEKAGCSSASVWRYWRMLGEGKTPKVHNPHANKRREPKPKKPHEARFYRSTFEPA